MHGDGKIFKGSGLDGVLFQRCGEGGRKSLSSGPDPVLSCVNVYLYLSKGYGSYLDIAFN